MKKNKMMRLASVLLVCVLLTTSVISGTFAKYVTSDSAKDTARVAKFGVVVTASGSLYSNTYVDQAHNNTPGSENLTVKSIDDKNVVAPGTQSTAAGLSFAVTGQPEVKVQVTVAVADTWKDVFLKQKDDLPDMTTGNANDKFNNTADYYPVKYTLTQTKNGSTTPLVSGGKLSAVETALEGLSKKYDANTDLANEVGTLNLTWAWDFDDSGKGTNDKQDTLLGDLAAGTTLTPTTTLASGTDYNLTSSIEISITVTQVD